MQQTLVEQIKQRKEEGITSVLETYGGLLNAIIRKYLHGNQRDIEECLADVLVSIWFHIDSFDSTKNEFKQWIAAIAKYKAIDYVRKAERKKKYVYEVKMDKNLSIQAVTDPSNVEMRSLLEELPEDERTIFEKYYVEGVPSKEIATQFQVKESWVHNKLSRGRKKLKRYLLRNEV